MVFLTTENSEYQVLVNFSFLGDWGGVLLTTQNSKCQVLANFPLGRGTLDYSKLKVPSSG